MAAVQAAMAAVVKAEAAALAVTQVREVLAVIKVLITVRPGLAVAQVVVAERILRMADREVVQVF